MITGRRMRLAVQRSALCVSIILCGVANTAHAQSSDQDAWHYGATVYAYFPSLYGETTFPGGTAGPIFRIDAHRIVKGLNLAFMGKFSVRHGNWGAFADVFHADVSDSVNATHAFSVPQVPVPVGVTGNFKLGAKTTLLTLAGTYRFVAEPDHDMSLVFGARMYDSRQRLDWTLSAPLIGYPNASGQSRVGHTRWDAIVGVSGHQRFGTDLRWFVPYYVDAGSGDSRFTWQALIGVGYAFQWGEVAATWRYIDYDFKSGSLVSRMSYSGPAVGLTWRF
ncbi:MAG: hypothetical protein OJF55_000778 [Rhodanobacteraceae bacterium]|nr:MAG: hypothetical protein OJF55_000778 [Rhodanobacteraceae bacterium]